MTTICILQFLPSARGLLIDAMLDYYSPQPEHYRLVKEWELEPGTLPAGSPDPLLRTIFQDHQAGRSTLPPGMTSMSPGDVILIGEEAYLCKPTSFDRIPF